MDRFIYITDLHFGAKPISRKDDYNAAILEKMEFVFKLAKKNNCVVLFGGDLTDTPKIKFFELMELMKLFSKYKEVPFFGIFGNPGHDGLVDSSPFTFMKMSGFIRGDGMYQDFEDTRVIFCGHGCQIQDMDKYIHVKKYNVLMTHHTLVTEPVIFEHILINEAKTEADMVTIGHYHAYQGILKRDDGKVFVAPGAMARKKRTKEDMERIPKCVYFSISGKELKSIKEIDIPCKMDIWTNKKVLELDDDVLYNDINAKVNDMKDVLTTTAIYPSLKDGIEVFGKEIKVDQRIIDYTQERIKNI